MPGTEGDAWERVERVVAAAGPERRVGLAASLLGTARSWGYGADEPFPAASTIKLPILVALHQEAAAGRVDLAEERPIPAAARVGGSGVLAEMSPALRLTLADLAYLMIAVSDNTASNVLLDALGPERVRRTMADCGMGRSVLGRRFLGRLPRPEEGENVTTAADLVALLAAIAEGRAASPAACAEMRRTLGLQQHRELLARRLPEGLRYGGKSGWLPGLAHDAGLIEGPGGTLAIAVLTSGFTDPIDAHEAVWSISAALIEASGVAG
jgi:beta-lactamase class A